MGINQFADLTVEEFNTHYASGLKAPLLKPHHLQTAVPVSAEEL